LPAARILSGNAPSDDWTSELKVDPTQRCCFIEVGTGGRLAARMSEHFENRKNGGLRRFAAVSFIEQKVREGFGVVQALRLAALRPWPDENGRYSSARTLEDYWYAWKSGGFADLQPKSRGDEGVFRKMPAEVGQWLLSQVSQYPEIPLKVLYERWTQAGQPLPSLRTLYRFLRSKGYDAASLRRGRLQTGPTKAFEAPFVNDLWMTDFSPGPKLNVDGKVLKWCVGLVGEAGVFAFDMSFVLTNYSGVTPSGEPPAL
jgi:hypothetical protein